MPTSIREQWISALTTALLAEWGTPFPTTEAGLPFTRVLEGADAVSLQYDTATVQTSIEVGRMAKATSTELATMRAEANQLLADLQTEAATAATTLDDLLDGIDYAGGDIGVDSKFIYAVAELTVHWHHVRDDPYTIDAA